MISRNNKGLSIVEVLVVMGLVALIASLSAGFIVSQRQQDKLRQLHVILDSYKVSIKSIFALNSACTMTLPKNGAYLKTGTVNLVSEKGLKFFKENFHDDIFYISSALLTYDMFDDVYTDQSYKKDSRELLGNIVLDLSIKPDVLGNMRGYDSVKSNQITIPIKMYSENYGSVGNAWKGVSCSAEDSEEIAYKAQICNLYGGSLTDGAHCDFAQINRTPVTHSNNLTKNPWNIPVGVLVQNNTNQVKRVRLMDIMCYIDSLMLLTEDLASADGAGKKETVYCPYPGGTDESRISLDAKKFFK